MRFIHSKRIRQIKSIPRKTRYCRVATYQSRSHLLDVWIDFIVDKRHSLRIRKPALGKAYVYGMIFYKQVKVIYKLKITANVYSKRAFSIYSKR